MVTVAVATFGFLAARRLPVDLLPDLSYPTLTVQTLYPDAPPISVEQFVTRPIEEAVGVVAGVREMRSASRPGVSEVILEFEWDRQMDFAALDVREKLGLVRLPREVEPSRVLRYDPSLDPFIRLALAGERDLGELRQLAERWLKPRLEAVGGVAAVKVRGGLDPEIHVQADDDRLAALGLTLGDLAEALQSENVNQPGGTVKDFNAVYLVRTLHEFENLEQLRRTVVRETAQGRVRVEDVAAVTFGHRDRDEITRNNGREVVELALHREGSANTVAASSEVRQQLESIRAELPDDLQLTLLTDQSAYIADAVGQVWLAALLGGALAIVVIFFFLRDPSPTLIIALSIPVSVLATFLPMQQFGVSLNIMSLGGLALGVGMLVDNSIVVLEAIDRRRRDGHGRKEAAPLGAGDVAGAVTASTLTTISVFFPIVFVQGIAGQLFYDQAVTVCFSLLASLLVSLTLIPALASFEPGAGRARTLDTLFRWDATASDGSDPPWTMRAGGLVLAPVGDGRHFMSRALTILLFPLRLVLLLTVGIVGALWWAVSRGFHVLTWPLARSFESLGTFYGPALSRALRYRWLVLVVAFGIFGLSLAAIPMLGTNLVPDLSQGEFAFQLRLAEGSPLETTSQTVGRIESTLAGDPRYERIFSLIGSLPSSASGRRTLGENLAQINFRLREGADAEAEAAAVARVREVLLLFPNVDAELVHPSVLVVRPPIAVQIFSDDLDALDRGAKLAAAAIDRVPGVVDISTTSEPGSPEVIVEMNTERAGALGVTADLVATTLRRQIRGDVVGTFRDGEERLDIRLRATETARDRASEVDDLRIRLPEGTVIPVSAVANVSIGRGPAAIHRFGGSRVAEVTAKIGAAHLGETLERVREAVRRIPMPAAARAELGGQDEELRLSFRSLQLVLLLAVFLVYVVMAAQFESLVYPLVILIAVPLGAVGVVAALLLTSHPVSVLVLIGAVMLAGIVVNNAIVLVDAINRRRREGQPLDDAIVAGGRERLRPILMTTTTTVLALLPMALGLGAGDELRAPLAITVIGGLTVATLLTLLVIPCLYRALSGGAVGPEVSGAKKGASPVAPAPKPAEEGA